MNIKTLLKVGLFAMLCLLVLPVMAQNKTVTGTVTDATGPVPGVTVMLKGTKIATTTTANGKYTLEVADGKGILVFSFEGYTKQEINIDGQTAINVVLKPSETSLNEVVVVGYGSQKKVNLTGAVSIIDKKTIENRPLSNSVGALQGSAPGLVVTRTNGQPGQEG